MHYYPAVLSKFLFLFSLYFGKEKRGKNLQLWNWLIVMMVVLAEMMVKMIVVVKISGRGSGKGSGRGSG